MSLRTRAPRRFLRASLLSPILEDAPVGLLIHPLKRNLVIPACSLVRSTSPATAKSTV
jgi:hypothetical protein